MPLQNDDPPAPVPPVTPMLEICVDCQASVEACQEASIPRIELCAGLVEGGTTPSWGFLRRARATYDGRIMMMIRPRAGDFVVTASELQIMIDDIQAARDHGADGVVFGCLRPDGTVDAAAVERLLRAAGPMDVTFHRAFDVSLDVSVSLESLMALGVRRVLTSGGQASVDRGLATILALQQQAAGRISLLVGGGLRPDHLPRLQAHGLHEFHLSARTSRPSPMVFRRPDVPMSAAEVPGDEIRREADPVLLRTLMGLLRPGSSSRLE